MTEAVFVQGQGSIVEVTRSFDVSLAIVVGVDRYDLAASEEHPNLPARVERAPRRLLNAVKDASEVKLVLSEQHGYSCVLLPDQEATKEAILEAIRLARGGLSGRRTRLFFYFAGHGVALHDDQGPRGYLAPYGASTADESSLLSMNDLIAAVDGGEAQPRAHHCMVVLDCCFSGLFRWAVRDIAVPRRSLTRSQYERFTDRVAWQLLCSSAANQTALDTLADLPVGKRLGGEEEHSPFAAALLDGLKGKADLSGDGVITATELYAFVRDAVEKQAEALGTRQTPGLWPGVRHSQGEFIFGVPERATDFRPEPELRPEDNPYRGTAAFREEDAPLFFGREAATSALLDRVRSSPLTVVLGATGSGKTSLVCAGLLPALRREGAWVVARMGGYAGERLRQFAEILSAAEGEPFGVVSEEDLRAPNALTKMLLGAVQARPVRGLVVVIDPFEASEEADSTLLRRLEEAMKDAPAYLRVVLVVRADQQEEFEPVQPGSPQRGPWRSLTAVEWQAARFELSPLTREGLRMAAERPALDRAFYFEPQTLVDDLVDEARKGGSAAPALLSAWLFEAFEGLAKQWVEGEHVGRAITNEMFDGSEGVKSWIERQRRSALKALAKEGAAAQASWLLGRLCRKNEKNEWVPKSVALRDIEPERAADWMVARRALEAHRLVVSENIAGMGASVSLTHPAIAQIDASLADRTEERWREIHGRLSDAASAWAVSRARLWVIRGSLLDVGRLARACPGRLSRVEERFRRLSRRWRSVVYAAAGLVALSLLLFVGWSIQSDRMASARRLAEKSVWLSEPASALRMAIEAASLAHTDETDYALRRALIRDQVRGILKVQGDAPSWASFSVDGKFILATSEHAVELWRMPCGEPAGRIVVEGEDPILRTRFDPASGEVVLLRDSMDGSYAERWTLAGPAKIGRSPAHDVMLRPDGTLVAWIYDKNGSRLEDLRHAEAKWAIPGDTWAVAPDGTAALYCLDNRLRVTYFGKKDEVAIELRGRVEPQKPGEKGLCEQRDDVNRIHEITVSPDGRSLAMTRMSEMLLPSVLAAGGSGALINADGTYLWNDGYFSAYPLGFEWRLATALVNPQAHNFLLLEITHNLGDPSNVAGYSPLLAIPGSIPTELRGHTGWISGAAFSKGVRLATASDDGTARVWDLSGALDRVLVGHTKAVRSVEWSSDDRFLLTASADGTVRLWDADPPEPMPEEATPVPESEASEIQRPTFVPPSGELSYVSADGNVAVLRDGEGPPCPQSQWTLAKKRTTLHVYRRGTPQPIDLSGCATSSMREVWVSPGGHFVVLSDRSDPLQSTQGSLNTQESHEIIVWRTGTGGTKPAIECVDAGGSFVGAISVDDRLLAIGCGSETLLLPAAGGEPYELKGHLDGIEAIAFSPDGRMLATGDRVGDVRLWDAVAVEPLRLMRDHQTSLRGLVFSPDGALLASSAEESGIRIWDTRTGQRLTTLSDTPTPARLRFSPDGQSLLAREFDGTQVVRHHLDIVASGKALLDIATAREEMHAKGSFPGCPRTQ